MQKIRQILLPVLFFILGYFHVLSVSALEAAEAEYTVVYWQERAPYGNPDGKTAYEYVEQERKTGAVGSQAEYTDKTGETAYEGFSLDTGKSEEEVLIAADGRTVKNVYYNRNTYSIRFFDTNNEKEWEELRVEARYGQDISEIWNDEAHAAYIWISRESSADMRHVLLAAMPAENLEFYARDWGRAFDYVYYIRNKEKNWTRKWYVSGLGTGQQSVPDIPGFYLDKSDMGKFQGFSDSDSDRSYFGRYFLYERKSYSLILKNCADENGNAIEEKKIPYDDAVDDWLPEVFPPASEGTGSAFAGWYTAPVFTENAACSPKDYRMPAHDVVLYAKWENPQMEYQVEHYRQNVEDDGYTLYETETAYGTPGQKVSVQGKEEEHFFCVTKEEELEGILSEGLIFEIYYDRKEYEVTFLDEKGEVLSRENVRYEKDAHPPAAPTKEADEKYEYSFLRWNGTWQKVSREETVTAEFEQKKRSYGVSYQIDGVLSGKREEYPWGDTVKLRSVPVREGYVFSGWKAENAVSSDGSFLMPAQEVVWKGSWKREEETTPPETQETEPTNPETETQETEPTETETQETKPTETEAVKPTETETKPTETAEQEESEPEEEEKPANTDRPVEPDAEVPETEQPEAEETEPETESETEREPEGETGHERERSESAQQEVEASADSQDAALEEQEEPETALEPELEADAADYMLQVIGEENNDTPPQEEPASQGESSAPTEDPAKEPVPEDVLEPVPEGQNCCHRHILILVAALILELAYIHDSRLRQLRIFRLRWLLETKKQEGRT